MDRFASVTSFEDLGDYADSVPTQPVARSGIGPSLQSQTGFGTPAAPPVEPTAASPAVQATVRIKARGWDEQHVVPAQVSPRLLAMIANGQLKPGQTYTLTCNEHAAAAIADYAERRRLSAAEVSDGDVATAREVLAHAIERYRRHRAAKKEPARDMRVVLSIAEGANQLLVHPLFEAAAGLFGERVRSVAVPYPCSVSHMPDVATRLREALDLGRPRRTFQDFSQEETRALEDFFGNTSMLTHSADAKDSPNEALRLPQRPPEWERDDAVATCSSCRQSFGWMPGSKSHCRVCRRVKCRACLMHFADFPGATCYKPTDDPNALKCCSECWGSRQAAIFGATQQRLLREGGLTVIHIGAVQLVGDDWRRAAHVVLGEYRSMFAATDLTADQHRMLLASAPLLGGHPQQVVRLFEAVDFARDEPMAEKALAALRETVEMCARGTAPRFAHRHMMCRRACLEPMLDLVGAQLLRALSGVDVAAASPRCQAVVVEARGVAQQLLVEHARSEAQRMCWVPILLDLLHRDLPGEAGDSVIETLLALCEGQPAVAMQAYRECIARRRDLGPGESFLERLLDTVRSRVERLPGVFPDVRRLHSASAFVEALEEATKQGAETAAQAQGALLSALRERRLITTSVDAPTIASVAATALTGSGHIGSSAASLLTASRGPTPHSVPSQSEMPPSPASQPFVTPHNSSVAAAAGSFAFSEVVIVEPFPYIFDPSITIVAVHLGGVCVKRSKMRPWEVPLIPDGAASPAEYRKVLYKREDVRKDYVVCNVVAALDGFFRRKQLLTHHIARYRVLPTSKESGIIEMVRSSTTVEGLSTLADNAGDPSAQSLPLRAWVDARLFGRSSTRGGSDTSSTGAVSTFFFAPLTTEQAQLSFCRHFVESASFYLLATYLLGVGDRHRGNVLVRHSGSLCHIDFGFVLGERPLTATMLTSRPEPYVRYDTDLKEALVTALQPLRRSQQKAQQKKAQPKDPRARPRDDRRPEDPLRDFWAQTTHLFVALRPHAAMLQLLLEHYVVHGIKERGDIVRHLTDRTFALENDPDARTGFSTRIEDSLDATWAQDLAREVGGRARDEGVRSAAAVAGQALLGGVLSTFRKGWGQ